MARSRGHAEYSAAPLRHGRGHRRAWLRTAQLNAVGWAALLGVCVIAAAVGVAVARAMALPSWWGAAVAVVPLGAVVLTDRKHWAAMETRFGWGGSAVEVARIASELQAQGVATRVRADTPTVQGWGEPVGPLPGGPMKQTASLSYSNRDAGRVRTALRGHGIDLPNPSW